MDFIRDTNLILYLPLYELDGASIQDRSAYGHLSVVTGALWTPQGRSFDGVDDQIAIATSTVFDIPDTITLEGWINIASVVSMAGFIARSTGWELRQSASGQIIFLPFIDAAWRDGGASSVLSASQWFHIAFTYSSATRQALTYRDAVLESSVIFSGLASYTLGTGAASVLLGYDVLNGVVFNGKLGEIRIYNRVLSAVEIQNNYLATKWRYQ
ncbi:MAG: LamG domain-containing protein [Chloroflexota bacterium]